MVGHEDVGMKGACMRAAGSQQEIEVKPVVVIRIEGRLTVISALGDMLRYSWQMESGGSGHGMSSLNEGCHFAAPIWS